MEMDFENLPLFKTTHAWRYTSKEINDTTTNT